MNRIDFTDANGTFRFENADRVGGLYFPIASERGLKSCLTPDLAGDAKLDQNHFLLEPVSIGDLAESRASRNFWLVPREGTPWSVTGRSAWQMAAKGTSQEEEMVYEAGFMWQKVTRRSMSLPVRASITSFIPHEKNAEVHLICVTHTGQAGDSAVSFTPFAAVPIYGRSADNIRDHRHVTSLLNRIYTTAYGVHTCPTMSFDERGHKKNTTVYFVDGLDENGKAPVRFIPVKDDFIGENGTLENPQSLRKCSLTAAPAAGQEAMGAFAFAEKTLLPGESATYILLLGVAVSEDEIEVLHKELTDLRQAERQLAQTRRYWQGKVNVCVHTGDPLFDQYMKWIAFQPELRRLFGCSFLPHHDYGRGGRGWRDLWQDCLALLLLDPEQVRNLLLENFAGVRLDGTNATIIGENPGEFQADRNRITRVWMDHAMWPLMTTQLYIDQTGDDAFLLEKQRYFDDGLIRRGTARRTRDTLAGKESHWLQDEDGRDDLGSVLEHLLVENLTAIWEIGEHGALRLRDADWNDALDMARERGESVAFTHAYVRNLRLLAALLTKPAFLAVVSDRKKEARIVLREELGILLEHAPRTKKSGETILARYFAACGGGKRIAFDPQAVAARLTGMADEMTAQLKQSQWLQQDEQTGWFISYYDNDGKPLDRVGDTASQMLLTGQVFAIMGGTADGAQVQMIAAAADRYLYDDSFGGYRLNTDFGEVKMNMGRMFGFAFGEKENGAVFSHMAVMYANALYVRGLAAEGWKALRALYRQAADMDQSRMLPGIPEYFGHGGRGLYSYLTGAGSWYLLTVVQEMFGVRGESGDLLIMPSLLPGQFDAEGKASIALRFAGQNLEVRYALTPVCLQNGKATRPESTREHLPVIRSAQLDGQIIDAAPSCVRIGRQTLLTSPCLDGERAHVLLVCLEQ